VRRVWVAGVLLVAACSGDPAPAPAPGPVEVGYVGVASSSGHAAAVEGSRAFDPADARLEGPHFAVSVTGVARVTGPLPDAVAGAFGLDAGAAPAAGRELVLVDLTPTEGRPPATAAELTVEVAGRAVRGPLDATVAVDAPAGTEPTLRVTDAGRTQTLDLTTGRRTAEVAGFYPLPTGGAAATGAPATLVLYGPGVAGQSKGDRTATVGLARATASLQPWVEGRGWAADGRRFLVLDAALAYDRPGAPAPDTVTVPAASFSAGAVRLTGPAVTLRGPTGTARFVADVPAATDRVALRFAFRGTIRAAAGEVTAQPAGGGPQTVTVVLR
jgi:hypothetical protein